MRKYDLIFALSAKTSREVAKNEESWKKLYSMITVHRHKTYSLLKQPILKRRRYMQQLIPMLMSASSKTLTLMRSSADSLKKSAEALGDASLYEKKKFKKKDEKTGEETEVEDYDWDAITKAVKTFIDDYNAVVEQAGNFSEKGLITFQRGIGYISKVSAKNLPI